MELEMFVSRLCCTSSHPPPTTLSAQVKTEVGRQEGESDMESGVNPGLMPKPILSPLCETVTLFYSQSNIHFHITS